MYVDSGDKGYIQRFCFLILFTLKCVSIYRKLRYLHIEISDLAQIAVSAYRNQRFEFHMKAQLYELFYDCDHLTIDGLHVTVIMIWVGQGGDSQMQEMLNLSNQIERCL
eukprot:TRINITY_DN6123_c0_g1_i16.p4 TRINITY_DN6123_c0_g1~~TRINITY_DN6123_c0_g1_i16.p4  ORF type:complete len:109 (-),score=6.06 TRINITY_DN6123_c0_g1_i16:173-499(-)